MKRRALVAKVQPDTYEAVDAARAPGESRSACVDRLLRAALGLGE